MQESELFKHTPEIFHKLLKSLNNRTQVLINHGEEKFWKIKGTIEIKESIIFPMCRIDGKTIECIIPYVETELLEIQLAFRDRYYNKYDLIKIGGNKYMVNSCPYKNKKGFWVITVQPFDVYANTYLMNLLQQEE